MENFQYQWLRKVSRNIVLNKYWYTSLSSIFALNTGAKGRFSHEGTLCESATVPAAVISRESEQ